jgi:hypothetical protein
VKQEISTIYLVAFSPPPCPLPQGEGETYFETGSTKNLIKK